MKKIILAIVTISSLVFTGCALDNDDQNSGNTGGGATSQNLAGNLTGNLTLSSGIEHTLTGALLVKDGATLTIEPGVTVKALAGGTDVYILVEKGGKIIADGTAANPIVFTSNATSPQAGDWGGIIINGEAPISRQPTADSNAATEVNNRSMSVASSRDLSVLRERCRYRDQ